MEETIWRDILAFLHDPDPILAQLVEHLQSRQVQTQDLEQERLAQALALSHKEAEKERMLDLYRRGRITVADLERQLEKTAAEAAELKGRLSTLETTLQGQAAIATRLLEARHLLETLRARLKEEFTWDEQRELVEALVFGIRVDSPLQITVTYAFDGSAATRTLTRGNRRGISWRAAVRLWLDTHVFLWWLSDDATLSPGAREERTGPILSWLLLRLAACHSTMHGMLASARCASPRTSP